MVKIPTGKELAEILASKVSLADAFAAPFTELYNEDEKFKGRVTSFNGHTVDGPKDDVTLATDQLREYVKAKGRADLAGINFQIIKRVVGTLRRRAKISPKQLTDQSSGEDTATA